MKALRLCIYCLGFLIAEIFLFASYRHHDARFHWFLHFFVGASFALAMMSIFAWRYRHPCPYPLLWILLGHIIAMIPDFLFLCCSVIHQSWMDIFLWHIGAHFIPGRNWSWYAIFIASLTTYFVTIVDYAERNGIQSGRRIECDRQRVL